MSEPARCLSCGYVLIGLPRGRCPECGRAFDPDDPSTFSDKPLFVRWKFWLPAFLVAAIGGTLLYALLIFTVGWGWAVTIVAPICLGMIVGHGCRVGIFINLLLALLALGAVVFGLWTLSAVGVFCGLVVSIVALVPVLFGALIGIALRHYLKGSNFDQRWYFPALVVLVVLALSAIIEAKTDRRPQPIESVVTSMRIPASAGRTWNAIMFYEEVHHRPPWLLRLGLPKPLYTRGSTERVGDAKVCVYIKGRLAKRVTERVAERRLTFDVILQDNIENHSVRLTDGSFALTQEGTGQTRVALTTRYEPKLAPRWIWRPAERLAIHTMYRYVLEGMRQKAVAQP